MWLQLAEWTGSMDVDVFVVEVVQCDEVRNVLVDFRIDVDDTRCVDELEV